MATDSRLQDHRSIWEQKPVLRAIYRDLHRHMHEALPTGGSILEIGAVGLAMWLAVRRAFAT